MRILLCGAQVPFARGGAEILLESLRDELAARGHEVDIATVPYVWSQRLDLLRASLAWRLLDLRAVAGRRVDLVVATRFPSYLVKHPNKVVWLVHQLRQVYDLHGTEYSDFAATPRDERVVEMVRAMDRRTLLEARALFTISRNTAERLDRHNGLRAEVLYPPPKLGAALRPGPFGDYVLGVGRLDRIKRFDLLVRALRHAESGVRARIAGAGPEAEALRALAERLGVAERVDFLGAVGDRELVDLYAGALAVFYAPYDEDYGYVTVEAFKAAKPVVTAADAGGVLEFVVDGVNGCVCPPDAPREIGARLDALHRDRDGASRLGRAGQAAVAAIGWDEVVRRLTGAVAL
jgi:glycosyltransferase involved in cell wall biosynthesis